MKKTLSLAIAAILVLTVAFGAGLGTYAYYTKTMTSTGNTLTTAAFVVNPSTGILNSTTNSFTVSGDDFAPGLNGTQNFSIEKTGTEVPVEYRITVTTTKTAADQLDDDYIFRNGTPVKLYLVDATGTILKEIISGKEMIFEPTADTTGYGVKYEWPWATTNVDDKSFAGDAGIINLSVEARQIKPGAIVRNVYMRDARPGVTKAWDRNNMRDVEFATVNGIKTFTVKDVVADMLNGNIPTQLPYGDIVFTQKTVDSNAYTATVNNVNFDVTLQDGLDADGINKLYFKNSGQNFELKINKVTGDIF